MHPFSLRKVKPGTCGLDPSSSPQRGEGQEFSLAGVKNSGGEARGELEVRVGTERKASHTRQNPVTSAFSEFPGSEQGRKAETLKHFVRGCFPGVPCKGQPRKGRGSMRNPPLVRFPAPGRWGAARTQNKFITRLRLPRLLARSRPWVAPVSSSVKWDHGASKASKGRL